MTNGVGLGPNGTGLLHPFGHRLFHHPVLRRRFTPTAQLVEQRLDIVDLVCTYNQSLAKAPLQTFFNILPQKSIGLYDFVISPGRRFTPTAQLVEQRLDIVDLVCTYNQSLAKVQLQTFFNILPQKT